MRRILPTLLLLNFVMANAFGQSFTVRDLLEMGNTPSNNITYFMNKNGFALNYSNPASDTLQASYIARGKRGKPYKGPLKSIDYYSKDNSRFFLLHTLSYDDFIDGEKSLIRSSFIFDKTKDINKDSSILFQKQNMAILAFKETKDSVAEYTFKLQQKKIPDSVVYAEDLLQFDSNEFLVSYFGAKNVTKDLYYFSEKELKKCSVLFSGTPYQAAFVWGDEDNLSNLAYIIVSNVLPTKRGLQNGVADRDNAWKFTNGVHLGMALRDLLRLNESDFDVYGINSELAFMIKPNATGKINFKKTAIMLTCNDCYGNKLLEQPEVSALDLAKANLPLRVFDVIIYP
jgi:hypothetical protein